MVAQGLQRATSVRNRVLQLFRHFGVGLFVTVRLEAGIPTEVARTAGHHDATLGAATEHLDWVGRVSVRIRECAERVGRLVLPSGQQLVQTFRSQLREEPLDVRSYKKKRESLRRVGRKSCPRMTLYRSTEQTQVGRSRLLSFYLIETTSPSKISPWTVHFNDPHHQQNNSTPLH